VHRKLKSTVEIKGGEKSEEYGEDKSGEECKETNLGGEGVEGQNEERR
jgi:hypothetical protein